MRKKIFSCANNNEADGGEEKGDEQEDDDEGERGKEIFKFSSTYVILPGFRDTGVLSGIHGCSPGAGVLPGYRGLSHMT